MYKTEILKIKQKLIEQKEIEQIRRSNAIKKASKLLKEGQVVAFPTETVYGLGADALNKSAVKKIFKAKGRPVDNPLIIHIANKNQLPKLIKGTISPTVKKLITEFWPGPLTIIFKKGDFVPNITTAGLDTVAVRMPSHPVTFALIKEVDLPLAAPSANSSGFPSPTKAEHVYNDLNGKIPLIIDGGICNIGVESTVIEVKENKVNILRPGGVPKENIIKVLKNTHQIQTVDHRNVRSPKSPGMKYKHYAPHTPLWIIKSGLKEIEQILKEHNINNNKTLIIATEEAIKNIETSKIEAEVYNMGSIKNLDLIAKQLFDLLRKSDHKEYELILIEEVPQKEIGEAVMNRLKKAAVKIHKEGE